MRYTAILNPTGYSLSGFSEKPDIQRYSTLSAYALQAAGEDDAEGRGVAPVRNRAPCEAQGDKQFQTKEDQIASGSASP